MAAQQVLPPDAVGHFVGAVLPYLAQHYGVRVLLPHRLPQTGDEGVRQLIRHVQPPPVRPRPEPAADDGMFGSVDVLPVAGTVLVQRGQGGDAPPAVVVVRPVLPLIPGVVGRGLRLSRVAEVAGGGAGVAEHPVQQHPHPAGVGGVAEGAKVRFRAQERVDGLVVGGAVAVVLCRAEDGAEVEGLHAQVGQKVQLFCDAGQGAAEKVPVVLGDAVLVHAHRAVQRFLLPVLVEQALSQVGGEVGGGWRPLAKSVGEDLIAQTVPEPVRNRLCVVVYGQLIRPQGLTAAIQPLQLEGVPHQPHVARRVQHAGEYVLLVVGGHPGHGDVQQAVTVLLQPSQQQTAGKTL